MKIDNNSISVFLPTYNEEKVLKKNVLKTYNFLKENFQFFELFIIDDCSTDSTPEIINELKKDIEFYYKRFETGPTKRENLALTLLESKYDIIIYMDIDLSVDLISLLPLVEKLRSADISIGSRYIQGSQVNRRISRLIISLLYNSFIKIYYKSTIMDHQCGFKAFKRNILRELIDQTGYDKKHLRGWFWDAEILIRAQKKGFQIVEIPVNWKFGPKTSFNLFDEIRTIPYIIKLRWKL